MNNDEVRYMIDRHLGKPKRYTEECDGMEECSTGGWVKHADYKKEIAELHEIINKLKCSASQEYNKGYSAGKYAGPDYNMRSN